MDLDRLVILYSRDISEAEKSSKEHYADIQVKKKFILAHINDRDQWHIFSYDINNQYISCPIDDLIKYTPFDEQGAKLTLPCWINKFSDKNPINSADDKEHVIAEIINADT